MRITKVKLSSRCKDGSLVQEYHLSPPVDHQDLSNLKQIGEVILKDLGGIEFFSLSSGILSMKGMIGDSVVYITHQKDVINEIELTMNKIFG
jgi:hypothetical protein